MKEKDRVWWTNSIYTCNGASNHSEWERQEDDYYATDPKTILPLLENYNFNQNIWEPSCWEWHLSKELENNWFKVISSDLVDRWYWTWWVDFLNCSKTFNWDIITNPPYKYAQEFVEKSIELIKDGCNVAMFLKLTFLEWQKRKVMFKRWWLRKVLVFSQRQMCAKNWDFYKYKSNAVAYARFIWKKWYKWDAIIDRL